MKRLLIQDGLLLALAASALLGIVGWLNGLSLWNNSFQADLTDCVGIPLVLWVVWYFFFRSKA